MKVLVCEFRQETNSFNPIISDMSAWEKSGIYFGNDIEKQFSNKPCALGGIIKALEDSNTEIIYSTRLYCQSGGPVDSKVVDYFLEHVEKDIKENLPLDGVVISYHGALQSTEYDDVEGQVAEKIRLLIGEDAFISVSTDLHAYISDKMVKNIDIICGYHTYPHVDYFETGYRAAKLGLECLNKENKPYMVKVRIPMIVSAASYTTLHGTFKELMDYGKSLVTKGDIIDFSIYQMQPWLDVSPGGSSVLVIASSYEIAQKYAKDIAQKQLDMRNTFVSNLKTIDEVIDIAEKNEGDSPVVLVDSADSSNAGATGDSMAVIDCILKRKSNVKAAIVVNSPKAAEEAFKVGVGNKAIFKIGGEKNKNAVSICAEGLVRSLHDGIYEQEGPAAKGMIENIGKTAVISFGNVKVIACDWMLGNGDLQLFRAFGVEPKLYQLIVVKACTSFRVAYEKITDKIYETDTPGAAPSNLKNLDFLRLPKEEFYPWNSLDEYEIKEIQFARK